MTELEICSYLLGEWNRLRRRWTILLTVDIGVECLNLAAFLYSLHTCFILAVCNVFCVLLMAKLTIVAIRRRRVCTSYANKMAQWISKLKQQEGIKP